MGESWKHEEIILLHLFLTDYHHSVDSGDREDSADSWRKSGIKMSWEQRCFIVGLKFGSMTLYSSPGAL